MIKNSKILKTIFFITELGGCLIEKDVENAHITEEQDNK
jgi:hypothetical protein